MWLAGGLALAVALAVVVLAASVESAQRTASAAPGPATPAELRAADLPLVWRGYDPGRVDALLGRAAAALEQAGDELSRRPLRRSAWPSFLPAEPAESGQELEDGGGDEAGGLDG